MREEKIGKKGSFHRLVRRFSPGLLHKKTASSWKRRPVIKITRS